MKTPIDAAEASLFVFFHLCCLFVFWVGVSWVALAACAALYAARTFALTAGFHRYFSHRTFKTTRTFQFVLGWVGACAAQHGPVWWAAHHRYHHKFSDTDQDRHSPARDGFWWAHVGWFLSPAQNQLDQRMVPDLVQYPELLFIDRYHLLPPASLAASLWAFGALLERFYPAAGTTGAQMVVWGFVVGTVLVYHATFSINSLCHIFGSQRFKTGDDSRNNLLVALITFGEGWHNNHHFYPASERQGFYRWEVDISHYLLRLLSGFGIVWDVRSPPERIYRSAEAMRTEVSTLNR